MRNVLTKKMHNKSLQHSMPTIHMRCMVFFQDGVFKMVFFKMVFSRWCFSRWCFQDGTRCMLFFKMYAVLRPSEHDLGRSAAAAVPPVVVFIVAVVVALLATRPFATHLHVPSFFGPQLLLHPSFVRLALLSPALARPALRHPPSCNPPFRAPPSYASLFCGPPSCDPTRPVVKPTPAFCDQPSCDPPLLRPTFL